MRVPKSRRLVGVRYKNPSESQQRGPCMYVWSRGHVLMYVLMKCKQVNY